MTEPTRGRGRPPGADYGVVKSIRFTEEDERLLAWLAREWGCSEAAVVRRLLREGAKEVGIRLPADPRVRGGSGD